MTIYSRLSAVFASGFDFGAAFVRAARNTLGFSSAHVPHKPGAESSTAKSVREKSTETTVTPHQVVTAESRASASPQQPAPGQIKAEALPQHPVRERPGTSGVGFQPAGDQPRAEVPLPPPFLSKSKNRGVPPPHGAPTSRQLVFVASGLIVLAFTVVISWIVWDSASATVFSGPETVIPARQPIAQSAPPEPLPATCPAQLATATAGDKDGRFPLKADVSGLIEADIAAFIIVGKEVAAAGRPRDAEVAFLMSCRIAEKLKGAGSVESADAKYQLAAHYTRQAMRTGRAAGVSRLELLKRAEGLYSESFQAYLVKYGRAHEKTRFAAEGLATVRQTQAQGNIARPGLPQASVVPANTTPPAPAQIARHPAAGLTQPGPAGAVIPKPQRGPVDVARVMPSLPGSGEVARVGPSFDCNRARSPSERIICSDAELARLDLELGRVYAQARNHATDRAAFRRRQDEEWRRREASCRDRDCLMRWYAQRYNQLMHEIQAGRR
jgi:hypothetical protein